jgi:hypothetical protein
MDIRIYAAIGSDQIAQLPFPNLKILCLNVQTNRKAMINLQTLQVLGLRGSFISVETEINGAALKHLPSYLE